MDYMARSLKLHDQWRGPGVRRDPMLASLVEKRAVTPRDTCYTFFCPPIAQTAAPGQFVEVKVAPGPAPYLRRPFSVFDADGREHFSLLVRSVGQGTAYMERWAPSDRVDVLGPLGHGFTWEDPRRCLLVAGGIGLAPMAFLARQLLQEGRQVRLLFSPARQKDLLGALPDLAGLEVVCAQDRTALPGLLDGLLADGADALFACGPEGLLESAAGLAKGRGVPAQLSVERRMACGFGVCLGCAVAIRTPAGLTYKKACKDGPVFSGEEVEFHEKP